MPIEKSLVILRKDWVRWVAGRSQREMSLEENVETRSEGGDVTDTHDHMLEGPAAGGRQGLRGSLVFFIFVR